MASALAIHPFGRFRRLIARPDRLSGLALSPKPIRDLLSRVTDRPEPPVYRVGHQAMTVSPLCLQRLIALIAHTSSTPASLERLAAFPGLFEEEPLAGQQSTRGARGSARKHPQICGNTPALLFDVSGLIDWLRVRYPRSTPIHVEAETGIPAASVENWLHRRSQPSVEHFTRLLSVYGPSLLHACLRRPPGWVEYAANEQRSREIEEQIARLQQERSAITSRAGEAFA